jgi:hypothetical protein
VPPTGKLSVTPRKFKEVVADLRNVVFSVIRDRTGSSGGVSSAALGTGFFVRSDIFITCHHVMNDPRDPHQQGDSYRLIANLTGSSATVHNVLTPQVGHDLTLFPSLDLAVLKVSAGTDQPFAPINYDDVDVGELVGVVGYPLAVLNTDSNGNLLLEGLIYRAARGAVTGRYTGTLPTGETLPVVEVNFMFVPGNSGGPVFEIETGKVVGMVQSIRWIRVAEQITQTGLTGQIPLGVSTTYIAPIHAIYSWGIKLDCLRTALEGFGVVP